MFLFRFPNGKLVLHTGDFRAAPQLLADPFLQPNQIDTVYLDTTYVFTNLNLLVSFILFFIPVIVIRIIVFPLRKK